jgi:hypothetical protein
MLEGKLYRAGAEIPKSLNDRAEQLAREEEQSLQQQYRFALRLKRRIDDAKREIGPTNSHEIKVGGLVLDPNMIFERYPSDSTEHASVIISASEYNALRQVGRNQGVSFSAYFRQAVALNIEIVSSAKEQGLYGVSNQNFVPFSVGTMNFAIL